MVKNTELKTLNKILNRMVASDRKLRFFDDLNDCKLIIRTPLSNYLVKCKKSKNDSWVISDYKKVFTIDDDNTMIIPASSSTINPNYELETVDNLLKMVRSRIYNMKFYPAFREIFQNSLGARDISDPELRHGARRIYFLLFTNNDGALDECTLVDDGVGMDLYITHEPNRTPPFEFNGDMGEYLWTITQSIKRKGLYYTVELEESRVNIETAGYFGIGFQAFLSVWKKVAVLSKMKNKDWAFTFNTNTTLTRYNPDTTEKGAFYAYAFPKEVGTIDQLRKSSCQIYQKKVIDASTKTFEFSKIDDVVIPFTALSDEVKHVIERLFTIFMDKLEVKNTITAHGTVVHGVDMTDEARRYLVDTDEVIRKIRFYTGFEKIMGIKRDIRIFLDDDTLGVDATTNSIYDEVNAIGHKINMTKKVRMPVRVRKKGIGVKEYERLEKIGNLVGGVHYEIKEIETELTVQAIACDNTTLGEKFERRETEVLLLQNGIPIVPIHFTPYYTSSGVVEDEFNQLSTKERDLGMTWTNTIRVKSYYVDSCIKMIVNANWITVNMGRNGILNDSRKDALVEFMKSIIVEEIKKLLRAVKVDEMNDELNGRPIEDIDGLSALLFNRLEALHEHRDVSDHDDILDKVTKLKIFVTSGAGNRVSPNDVFIKHTKNKWRVFIMDDPSSSDRHTIETLEKTGEFKKLNMASITPLSSDNRNLLLLILSRSKLKDEVEKKHLDIVMIREAKEYYGFRAGIKIKGFLPLDVKQLVKFEEEKKETETAEDKLIRRMARTMCNKLTTLLKSLISVPNEKAVVIALTKVKLPQQVFGIKITAKNLRDFVKKSFRFKILIVTTAKNTVAFYNMKRKMIGINKNCKYYEKMVGAVRAGNQFKLKLLLHNVIAHEMSHNEIVALIASVINKKDVYHKFPQFSDSLDMLETLLMDEIISDSRLRMLDKAHVRTRRAKRRISAKGSKKMTQKKLTETISRVRLINSKNLRCSCGGKMLVTSELCDEITCMSCGKIKCRETRT